MSHHPLCVLAEPCEPDYPDHGYCGFSAPRFCIHCSQWCICDRLAEVRADEREQAAQRVYSFCAHTKHRRSAPCVHDAIAAAVRGDS